MMFFQESKFPFVFFNELSTNPERFRFMLKKMSQLPTALLERYADDLKKEIEEGRIRNITPLGLLQTIVSMNITPFLLNPLFKEITRMNDEEYKKLINHVSRECINNNEEPYALNFFDYLYRCIK
jgi:hypothetical protein